MKGYKAFDKDLKCSGMQFEVGKTYTVTGDLEVCRNGLHFCEKLESVYGYYPRTSETRICEVEALGPIKVEGDKSATLSLRIVRELSHKEILDAVLKGNNSGNFNSGDFNSGYYNSGNHNSGNYNSGGFNSGYYNSGDFNSGDSNSGNYNSGRANSGHYNSGDCNSGNYNSGYFNLGNYNSGNRNSGYYNSGNRNSGYCNSGHYNSGNRNSGDCNSGNYNSGYFNSNTPYIRMFNKATKLRWDDERIITLNNILCKVKPILRWISSNNMTDEEKSNFPTHVTTGGYLKNTGRADWSDVTEKDFEFIKSLPNFDADIFEACTGVKIK